MRITTVTSLPSPSPLLLLLVQLLLWLILPGQEAVGAASTCPALCSCSNQASRVICTKRNLEEVPDSISNNTRYLNLQENSIQVNTDYNIFSHQALGEDVYICLFVCFLDLLSVSFTNVAWTLSCFSTNGSALLKYWGFSVKSGVNMTYFECEGLDLFSRWKR